jgi:membrane protease YdiL (CAAX protease family)
MNERLAQPSLITAIALAAEGGLVALALLLASWWGHNPWGNLQWTSDMLLANLAAIVMGAVAALPIMAGLVYFDRHPSEWLLPLKQSVDREVVPLFAHCGIPEFALIALAAGFGEELFFRGLLQGGIAREITGVWGTVAGLVVGSATFGVCHWLNREYALIASLIGVYLGLLLIVTGNLLAPIIAHALYDFFALWYLLFYRQQATPRSARDEEETFVDL